MDAEEPVTSLSGAKDDSVTEEGAEVGELELGWPELSPRGGKRGLHPNNKYFSSPPNFEMLCAKYPELAEWCVAEVSVSVRSQQ
jgi:hypothetical protein